MPELADKTYYELLGVSPEASTEEIKDAYKSIARAYHPDSNFYSEILGEEAKPQESDSDTFKRITEAYNTLINAERRKEYDSLFPKGLRDWDDIEVGIHAGTNFDHDIRRVREEASSKIYRPRGPTGTFKRTNFGIVDDTPKESAIDEALRVNKGGPITPIEMEGDRNIIPLFLGLLIGGFLAGGLLAYFYLVNR